MKKIFFSLVALAAIAACSKSEVEYDQTGAITLAPVASNATKSVAGYDGNTFDGVFPTAIDLCVFANAGENGSEPTAHNEVYFRNAQFKWGSGKGTTESVTVNGESIATTGAYAGNPNAYYWPNVKTLVFAGHSFACGYDHTKSRMNFSLDTLSIPEYVQNNKTYYAEGANDLMWFSCTSAYDKQTEEIVANMKHACSWITINVAGDDITATYTEGNPANTHTGWTLDSLVVTNLVHTGEVRCGATSARWIIADTAVRSNENYYRPDTGTSFTKTPAKYEDSTNNFIVIPQTPTTLKVTYTYESDPVNHISYTETKEISLDWDGVEGNKSWESGVHYIYNITITTTEILIDPVVKDWTPGATTNTTI